MQYEIVTLEAKTIAGLCTRTSNTAPDMGPKIGGLWQRLYGEQLIFTLPGRVGANTYGLYTNYETDVNGQYDVVAGAEVEKPVEGMPEIVNTQIPAGRYAKFSLVVDMTGEGIGNAWNDVWAVELPRAYTVDFEEYLPNEDMSKAPVNIYIALR